MIRRDARAVMEQFAKLSSRNRREGSNPSPSSKKQNIVLSSNGKILEFGSSNKCLTHSSIAKILFCRPKD